MGHIIKDGKGDLLHFSKSTDANAEVLLLKMLDNHFIIGQVEKSAMQIIILNWNPNIMLVVIVVL